jgi:hypothetical protein
MPRSKKTWLSLSRDAWALGAESAAVIALRSAKLARGGPAAKAESQRMVAEKVEAARQLQVMALTGALGFTAHGAAKKALKHYRRKVRANRRRLSGR